MNAQTIAYKSAQKISKAIDWIMMLVFILLMLIGGYMMLDTAYVFYQADPAKLPLFSKFYEEEVKSFTLSDLSSEGVAWLVVDDTSIDYAIMQAGDNNTYLNKTPTGEYSMSGSIFLDCRCNSEFEDNYSIVYGHHMASGYMFGALDAFESEAFFEKHRTGTLELRNGTVYRLNIFAFQITDAYNDEVFVPDTQLDIYGYLDNNVEVCYEHGFGRVLALSTCRNDGDTSRTVVFCELLDEPI